VQFADSPPGHLLGVEPAARIVGSNPWQRRRYLGRMGVPSLSSI
jgi:hypothetical protein